MTPPRLDELLLAAYTPRGVYLYRHDLQLGVATQGKSTAATGHNINLYGPRQEEDCDAALDVILAKLEESGCKCVAVVPWA